MNMETVTDYQVRPFGTSGRVTWILELIGRDGTIKDKRRFWFEEEARCHGRAAVGSQMGSR